MKLAETQEKEQFGIAAKEIGSSNYSKRELIEKIELKPFMAINDGEGWFLTLGLNRLTDEPKELDELKLMVDTKPWEIIMALCAIMVEQFNKIKELKEA